MVENEKNEVINIGDSPHTDSDNREKQDMVQSTGLNMPDSPQTDFAPEQNAIVPEHTDSEAGQEAAPAGNRTRINQRQYIKESERIISIDGSPRVMTQEEREKNDLLDIVESLKGGRILTDRLQGVERTSITGEPMAVLNHGVFKILIPASEMIDLPENLNNRTPNEVYYLLLHKRMGAEIDYIVKGISPDDTVAAASRKEAMASKRRHFYYGRDREGNNLLYEDACCEARVTCVFGGGIVVDLFGLETYIPLRELSWQRISRAQDRFSPGDRVIVRIQELDRSDRSNILVKTSIRLAQTNPYTEALKKYNVDSCYTGTVSHIDTAGVFVALDGGIDCLCSFPPRGRPPIGSRVSIYILGKDDDRQRIWGTIIHAAVPMMN